MDIITSTKGITMAELYAYIKRAGLTDCKVCINDSYGTINHVKYDGEHKTIVLINGED